MAVSPLDVRFVNLSQFVCLVCLVIREGVSVTGTGIVGQFHTSLVGQLRKNESPV